MLDLPKNPVIVVEDDDDTRKLLMRQLEHAGYQVSGYADGRAAVGPITAMNTGIVIADWMMPEMDGISLCAALRELQDMQAVGHIYVILLTAHNAKDKVVEGLKAGANDYLTKPYHPGEMLARVQVGDRMIELQLELVRRNVEVQKANAEMALLAQKLDQLANTDALTQLANRRCLFQRLDECWRVTLREAQPLSLVVFDLDHFKRVNDTHGHAAGDRALVHVAEALRQNARRPRLCGRFGGEEFMMILPNVGLADAAGCAERLRTSVAARSVVHGDAQVNVAVSCGVASRLHGMTSTDELVRCADAMLYLAKEHGRNQTWLCGPDGQPYAFSDPRWHALAGTCSTVAQRGAPRPSATIPRDADSHHQR